MKILIALFLITGSALADTFTGVGSTGNMLGLPASEFSFTLEYPSVGRESRPADPPSNIGAVQEVGKIAIKFSNGPVMDFPFYVTQFPSEKGFSLVGFYITNGYPHILIIEGWSEEKKFFLYESFRSPAATLTGRLTIHEH